MLKNKLKNQPTHPFAVESREIPLYSLASAQAFLPSFQPGSSFRTIRGFGSKAVLHGPHQFSLGVLHLTGPDVAIHLLPTRPQDLPPSSPLHQQKTAPRNNRYIHVVVLWGVRCHMSFFNAVAVLVFLPHTRSPFSSRLALAAAGTLVEKSKEHLLPIYSTTTLQYNHPTVQPSSLEPFYSNLVGTDLLLPPWNLPEGQVG